MERRVEEESMRYRKNDEVKFCHLCKRVITVQVKSTIRENLYKHEKIKFP